MSAFTDLPTTRRGEIGERLVLDRLRKQGYVIYPAPPAAHLVDAFAWREGLTDAVAIEVKTYPRRRCCEDTGVDAADWSRYTAMSTRVLLFFVDVVQRSIYYADVVDLEPCAAHEAGKVYFPLFLFQTFDRLTNNEIEILKS